MSAFRAAPADEVPWSDVGAVFDRGTPSHCWCQRFKLDWYGMHDGPDELRRELLHDQTLEGSTGLVGYLGDEVVGFVAVEPRAAYHRMTAQRLDLKRRGEDRADPGVWAVTCFVVRVGHRGTRLCYDLLGAAVGHAREAGARALEGYPMITQPGEDVSWGETHVGTRRMFTAHGFDEVGHPTKRRVVMRIEF